MTPTSVIICLGNNSTVGVSSNVVYTAILVQFRARFAIEIRQFAKALRHADNIDRNDATRCGLKPNIIREHADGNISTIVKMNATFNVSIHW